MLKIQTLQRHHCYNHHDHNHHHEEFLNEIFIILLKISTIFSTTINSNNMISYPSLFPKIRCLMLSKLTLSCKLATTEDFKLFGTPIKSEKLPITSSYDLISIFFENYHLTNCNLSKNLQECSCKKRFKVKKSLPHSTYVTFCKAQTQAGRVTFFYCVKFCCLYSYFDHGRL